MATHLLQIDTRRQEARAGQTSTIGAVADHAVDFGITEGVADVAAQTTAVLNWRVCHRSDFARLCSVEYEGRNLYQVEAVIGLDRDSSADPTGQMEMGY